MDPGLPVCYQFKKKWKNFREEQFFLENNSFYFKKIFAPEERPLSLWIYVLNFTPLASNWSFTVFTYVDLFPKNSWIRIQYVPGSTTLVLIFIFFYLNYCNHSKAVLRICIDYYSDPAPYFSSCGSGSGGGGQKYILLRLGWLVVN